VPPGVVEPTDDDDSATEADPREATVRLVRELDEGGFVVGGGVFVGETSILTAAHLGVDERFCWSRAPDAGSAWEAGDFVCDDIVEVSEPAGFGIDLALVRVATPLTGMEPPPVAQEPVAPGDVFSVSRTGELGGRVVAQGTVHAASFNNAWCDPWPNDSSFVAVEDLVGPGDSGGPAWIDGAVVGLVHGEACVDWNDEQGRHTFVHLPGILDLLPEFP